MRLLADECVLGLIVRRLRDEGHEVRWIMEDDPSLGDESILERAVTAGVPLLTQDSDFGELVFARQAKSAGVVLLRLHGLSVAARAELVARFFRETGEVRGRFIVISPGRVRVRGAQ